MILIFFKKNEGYIKIILLLFFSLFVFYLIPSYKIFKNIALIPGIGALFLFFSKIVLENLKYFNEFKLQNIEHDFALGTASHMAIVAYDKHVKFSEEYIEKVIEILRYLFEHGANKDVGNLAASLVRIRQNHSVWVTADIEKNLIPFESAIIKMSSSFWLLDSHTNLEDRTKIIDEIYRTFSIVIGDRKIESEEEERIVITNVVSSLRKILGIEELTELRTKMIKYSMRRLDSFN